MTYRSKGLFSILLILACSAPMASPIVLPHDLALPDDLHGVRQDKPDQMLFQVEGYSLTLGTEYRANTSPGSQDSGIWMRLAGQSLIHGSPVRQARISFTEPGVRARPARIDPPSQTLHMSMPVGQLELVLRLLEGSRPVYVQARFYGNGTVWTDVHTDPVGR